MYKFGISETKFNSHINIIRYLQQCHIYALLFYLKGEHVQQFHHPNLQNSIRITLRHILMDNDRETSGIF